MIKFREKLIYTERDSRPIKFTFELDAQFIALDKDGFQLSYELKNGTSDNRVSMSGVLSVDCAGLVTFLPTVEQASEVGLHSYSVANITNGRVTTLAAGEMRIIRAIHVVEEAPIVPVAVAPTIILSADSHIDSTPHDITFTTTSENNNIVSVVATCSMDGGENISCVINGNIITIPDFGTTYGSIVVTAVVIDTVNNLTSSDSSTQVYSAPAVNSPTISITNSTSDRNEVTMIPYTTTSDGSITSVTATSTDGSVVVDVAAQTMTFTPTNNFVGTATILAEVTDDVIGSTKGTTSSTITITIHQDGTTPTLTSSDITTDEDTQKTGSFTATSTGIITSITATSANGSVSVNKNAGTYIFSPASNFNGTTTIIFTIVADDTPTDGSTTINVAINAIDDVTQLFVSDGVAEEAVTAVGDTISTITISDVDDTIAFDFKTGTNDDAYYVLSGFKVALTQAGKDYLEDDTGNQHLPNITIVTTGSATPQEVTAIVTTTLVPADGGGDAESL